MALELGNRVTLKGFPEGHPLKHLEGKVGEIDVIGPDGTYLVDDQLKGGKREGRCDMREFVEEKYLKLG